jgi:bacterioferritin
MENEVKGDPKVIAALNEALKNELTSYHQYVKHGHLLEDWGFAKRSKDEFEEAEEERGHADKLSRRILLLGGEPQFETVGELHVGKSLREVIECDMRLELEGIAHYRKAVKICKEADDFVTEDLLKAILAEEEEHQDRYKTELELMERIGLELFAQLQV